MIWRDHQTIADSLRDQACADLLAARYLQGLSWSMIPAWCFIAIRNFMGAVKRPQPGLWVTLAAIPFILVMLSALLLISFVPELTLWLVHVAK